MQSYIPLADKYEFFTASVTFLGCKFAEVVIFCKQEMNRDSKPFQRIFGNPFAFIPLKATEPWLVEYLTLDLRGLLREIGFDKLKLAPSTPRHFTLAAVKPQQ